MQLLLTVSYMLKDLKFVTPLFQQTSRGAAPADHEGTPPPAVSLPDLQNSDRPEEKKDKK